MAERRALEAGVADRVRVHLCDYRHMPPSFEHAFDAMVTTEMIEVHIPLHLPIRHQFVLRFLLQAVGPRYMHQFFQRMDWALKPAKATMVITATSQPEFRYSEYQCVLSSQAGMPSAV